MTRSAADCRKEVRRLDRALHWRNAPLKGALELDDACDRIDPSQDTAVTAEYRALRDKLRAAKVAYQKALAAEALAAAEKVAADARKATAEKAAAIKADKGVAELAASFGVTPQAFRDALSRVA